jgi:hypothetical protein
MASREETVEGIAEKAAKWCAGIIDSVSISRLEDQFGNIIYDAIKEGMDDERERNAKIAEHPYSAEVNALLDDGPGVVGGKIAAAIREGREL